MSHEPHVVGFFPMLGSGSAGNALVVEERNTRLLLDCGFGLRETITRLARLGLAPEQLGHGLGDELATRLGVRNDDNFHAGPADLRKRSDLE